jgi:hypothetical protein
VVEQGKIVDYLLDTAHQYGASKAHFFLGFGFTLGNWEALARAFHDHGQQFDVTEQTETPFGPRYEVEGKLPTPDGRNPHVRTVWQVDKGQLAPRLITAYPVEEIV